MVKEKQQDLEQVTEELKESGIEPDSVSSLETEDTTKSANSDDIGSRDDIEENPTVDELNKKIDELNKKILDLQQQIKDEQVRALASLQNLQRRHKNELGDAHKFASTKFAKEMLPIRDCLEMALKDQSSDFENFRKGVELTLNQVNTAFDSVSIKELNPVGEVFDPNKHNAVSTQKSDKAPNTVLQVLQKGYVMSDRILRPAMVIVSSAQ